MEASYETVLCKIAIRKAMVLYAFIKMLVDCAWWVQMFDVAYD